MERSACPTCGSCSGMFTANSMNCLNEALGLALPQRHAFGDARARWELFEAASKRIVEMASSNYVGGDKSVLPAASRPSMPSKTRWRSTIAMGGSTNTVLATSWPSAHEAGVSFTMADMDRMSRKVPNLCKVAPSSSYPRRRRAPRGRHLHDFGSARQSGPFASRRRHRARQDHGRSVDQHDIHRPTATARPKRAPWRRRAAWRPKSLSRRTKYFDNPTTDLERGCIRDAEHAFSQEAAWRCCTATSPRRLHRENGRRRRIDLESSKAPRVSSTRRTRRATRSWPTRIEAAMCCDRLRRSARRPGHARNAVPDVVLEGQRPRQGFARSSPTAAFRAAPAGSASATYRPKPLRAARSR